MVTIRASHSFTTTCWGIGEADYKPLLKSSSEMYKKRPQLCRVAQVLFNAPSIGSPSLLKPSRRLVLSTYQPVSLPMVLIYHLKNVLPRTIQSSVHLESHTQDL